MSAEDDEKRLGSPDWADAAPQTLRKPDKSGRKEMIVIVHLTAGMTKPPIAIDRMDGQIEQVREGSIIPDDVLGSITPTGDMVDGPEESMRSG